MNKLSSAPVVAGAKEEATNLNYRIIQDEDAENPRNWDNAGKMVCWHRRYNLGDKHDFADASAFDEWWAENGKGGVLIPLGLLDHSGLHMWAGSGPHWSDSAGWDSGQIGWIYATAETIAKEWGTGSDATEKADKCLRCEVEAFDQYLTGDVYGVIIEDEEGNTLDSCFGFFGHKYAEQEAQQMLKYAQEHSAKEACLI